jgi:hypothetical protein
MPPEPDRFRILHDPDHLVGNHYMEVLPGRYGGQCWNAGSAYVDEEVFGYLEGVIGVHEPAFDHFAFTEIPRATWEAILADLTALAAELEAATRVDDLRGRVYYLFTNSEARFADQFPASARGLSALTRELVAWCRDQLRTHDHLTVLGM